MKTSPLLATFLLVAGCSQGMSDPEPDPSDPPVVQTGNVAPVASSKKAMYTGHARYGTGPDFDPKESSAGN